jgi:RNA polymerase sigma factor (sigma-70 family)
MDTIFKDVERALKPVLIHHAKKISQALGTPLDESLQEIRIALFESLSGYDYNRSHGKMHRYVDRVLRNSALSIIYQMTTQTRVPHVIYTVDGEQKIMRQRHLTSLDEIVDCDVDPSHTPAEVLEDSQTEDRRRVLKMRLMNKLSDRERQVFDCLCHPPEAFLVFLQNVEAETATHELIGEYMGLSKNAVDWALKMVRKKFTKIAESEFVDLIEGKLNDGSWPMIHVSRKDKPDTDFVIGIISKRGLDPRPLPRPRDIETTGKVAREIQVYPWGVVLTLKRGEVYRTMVLEGKFNKNTGEVAGTDGTWKSVCDEIPWYNALVKELRAA